MKLKKSIISAAAAIALAIIAAVSYFNFGMPASTSLENKNLQTEGTIVVNFLDVGQGDSEFIQLPNGKCMLIDAGTADYAETVYDEISSLGYEKIDYLVATHPHADHIGGMTEIVNGFDIGEIYMPKVQTDTRTFENLLQSVSDKGLSIKTASADTVIYNGDNLSIDLLAPVGTGYDDLNNYSAVVRLEYGGNVFLFMGDAEETAEQELLNKYSNEQLESDVIKVGHHGSSTSSCENFVRTVKPDYAVIEVGEGNSYGHPHSQSLERWKNIGAEILRTDINGNISVVSDGHDLTFICERD